MKPTVGRIVYYKGVSVTDEGAIEFNVASIITEVDSDTQIGLCAFYPSGLVFARDVKQGDKAGQWDWMPYQKGQAKKTEELEKKLSEEVKKSHE